MASHGVEVIAFRSNKKWMSGFITIEIISDQFKLWRVKDLDIRGSEIHDKFHF